MSRQQNIGELKNIRLSNIRCNEDDDANVFMVYACVYIRSKYVYACVFVCDCECLCAYDQNRIKKRGRV